MGQGPHFAGHYGKAAALLACAGRFHGSVQRKDVGLEGNGVDDADDVGDAACAVADAIHAGHHMAHHGAAALGGLGGAAGQMIGLARGVGSLAHGGGQLLHAGGRFLQVGCRLLGTRRQVVVARGNLGGRSGDGVHAVTHLRHQAAQPRRHARDRTQQVAELVLAAVIRRHGEVALGDGIRQLHCTLQRAGDGTRQHQGQRQARQKHHALDDPGQHAGLLPGGLGLLAGRIALAALQLHEDFQRVHVPANRTQVLLLDELAECRCIAGQLDLARPLVQRQHLGPDGGDALQRRLVRIAGALDDLGLQLGDQCRAFLDPAIEQAGQFLIGGGIAGQHPLARGLRCTLPLNGQADATLVIGQRLHAVLHGAGRRKLCPQRYRKHHRQQAAQRAPKLGGHAPLIKFHS